MINRRDFFKGSAVFGTALLAPIRKTKANEIVAARIPVLQGATSFTKTQINVMAAEEIVITVADAKVSVEKVEKSYSIWKAYRVVVDDLQAEKVYELVISTPEGTVLDTRNFSTLKPGLTKPRIALASCMRDMKVDFQAAMWKALEDQKPDLLFLLGDNVYVDDEVERTAGVSEEKIWRRYVETRMTLDLYHQKNLIPTVATWDDHDFGQNNTYGATPWREASTLVFRTLYAQDAIMPEVTWGPGIATSFSAYGQRFFLMDNRSFREIRYIGTEHWGVAQENWLIETLSQNKSPGWIFTGSQVFGGYRFGWSFEEHHPRALKRVIKRLSKIDAPVLFGSGDVHYSELMRIERDRLGYETAEITSSSMHSNAKEPQKGNKRRIASTGEFNFVVADANVTTSGLELAFRSYGAENKIFFEVEGLTISR